MMRDDYLMRAVQQVIAMLARIAGLRAEQRFDEAEQTIAGALTTLFGPLAATLERLTPKSAVSLIGDPEKLELYVALLRERAFAARGRGDEVAASALAERADALKIMVNSSAARETSRQF